MFSHVRHLEAEGKQMASLYQQMAAVEEKLRESKILRRQLENISNAEEERTQRLIEKMTNRNTILNNEIENLYRKSPVFSPMPVKVVNEVMLQRTKDFATHQSEKAQNYKLLMAEKQRLQDAQQLLREKRLTLLRLPTPEGDRKNIGRALSMQTVHSDLSVVDQVVMKMPQCVERICNLKDELYKEYNKKSRPYNGQLGIGSYSVWQIKDYVWIRKFVEDFLNDFVSKHIPNGIIRQQINNGLTNLTVDLLLSNTESVSLNRKVLNLLSESILLQVTHSIIQQVVSEVTHIYGTLKNFVDVHLMEEVEKICTGKEVACDPGVASFNYITNSFFAALKNRSMFRRDIWTHSQTMMSIVSRSPVDIQHRDDRDVKLITHFHLHPADLQKFVPDPHDSLSVKRNKECSMYHKQEIEYWNKMEPMLFSVQIPITCIGVNCMKASTEGCFMAVGCENGYILVYDVRFEPWRLTHYGRSSGRATVDLCWSLDSTHLVSVQNQECLNVWTMEGVARDKHGGHVLNFQPDNKRNIPKQLELICTLSFNRDFTFISGPVLGAGLSLTSLSPEKVNFFPSFSLFGVQYSICTSMNNGVVMKLDLEPLFDTSRAVDGDNETVFNETPLFYNKNLHNESNGVNIIGQNVKAELFHQHQHPIIHIAFLDNISKMVTVDDQGYINLWSYDWKYLCGSGYFIPEKKFKLVTDKLIYVCSSTDKPNVIFTDDAKNSRKGSAEIVSERTRVEKILNDMNLGNPWHEEYLPKKTLVASVYAPRVMVKDTGAVFHTVHRYRDTQRLSSYVTQVHLPVEVGCSRLLAVEQTPSGRELVFLLLYPEHHPKSIFYSIVAHMMILIIDLTTMQLRDLRQDIHLDTWDHDSLLRSNQVTVTFSPTRVLATTGAEYMFITVNGRLHGVSLTTGSLVMSTDEKHFKTGHVGCLVDKTFLSLPKAVKVTSTCYNGSIYAILHVTSSTTIQVIRFTDENSYETRRHMWKTCQKWGGRHPTQPEISVDRVSWQLQDVQHAHVVMRMLIMELVDRRVLGDFGEHVDWEVDMAVWDKIHMYNYVLRLKKSIS